MTKMDRSRPKNRFGPASQDNFLQKPSGVDLDALLNHLDNASIPIIDAFETGLVPGEVAAKFAWSLAHHFYRVRSERAQKLLDAYAVWMLNPNDDNRHAYFKLWVDVAENPLRSEASLVYLLQSDTINGAIQGIKSIVWKVHQLLEVASVTPTLEHLLSTPYGLNPAAQDLYRWMCGMLAALLRATPIKQTLFNQQDEMEAVLFDG